jgi:biopolymer transport protein ExbB/TolQ
MMLMIVIGAVVLVVIAGMGYLMIDAQNSLKSFRVQLERISQQLEDARLETKAEAAKREKAENERRETEKRLEEAQRRLKEEQDKAAKEKANREKAEAEAKAKAAETPGTTPTTGVEAPK